MAKNPAQEGLPVAVSTVGAFVATLLVLLAGTTNGTRPWILLMRAASAFLLVSGFLKLLTAGLIQVISWQRSAPKAPKRSETEDMDDAVQSISSTIRATELEPKGVS